MKQLDLSPRLAAIAALVPPGAKVADVGTDHAYLPVWLLLSGRIQSAVASDVNEGPLQRGRETARTYGVAEKIAFRRCDGLSGIAPQETDTVIIAGMGGDLMARILEAAPWTHQVQLILQPMSSQEVLRRWLFEHGYAVQRESLAREGKKFYSILTATGGTSVAYTPGEFWAGRQAKGECSPHRLDYLKDLLRRRQRALEGMQRSSAVSPETLAAEEALIADLQRMKEEWIQWQP